MIGEYAALVFSRASFERQLEERRELVREFQSELVSRSVLFLGTSFADPLMAHLLGELRNTGDRRPALPIHYTVRPPEKGGLRDRLAGYGIETIEVPDWRSVEALLAELKWRSRPHRIVISDYAPRLLHCAGPSMIDAVKRLSQVRKSLKTLPPQHASFRRRPESPSVRQDQDLGDPSIRRGVGKKEARPK